MNYALRNTLILTVLLILVFVGFLLGNTSSVKKLDEIKVVYEGNKKQLDELLAAHPDIKDHDRFVEALKDLEEKVKRESKLIPKKNDPTITYKYLLDICDNYCPDLRFNFIYNQLSKIEDIDYYTFTITGTAPVRSFYSFIYQIECQYMLYVIESIKITEDVKDEISTGDINFTLVLNAYFEETASEIGEVPFRKLKYKNITYDPFYSRIHAPMPNEREQEFLDIYSAGMIGLTPNKVFMKDRFGRIHILELGDKVAYGILEFINWKEQYAAFKLNEIGINKEKKIYLNELKED
ncbi:MAG: hypothetical protein KAS62_03845 [Candidatus Delongbacteria bacterium]|nr:hypothetical protein [Candidatus Delongbacteria bacterium]